MNKKQQILETAMKLFAEQGYYATSTQSISNEVWVSDALIFRHYKNKEGLLKAIFDVGAEKVRVYVEKILEMETAQEKVHAMIQFPLDMLKENKDFWKLSFSIKFQHPDLYKKLRAEDADDLVMGNLSSWFEELWVKDIEQTILHLVVFTEWLVQISIKKPEIDLQPLVDEWKAKF